MAYVFGTALVLFAMTVPIIAVIGLIGNQSQDWRREWWTRLGSWTGISGVGFLAISVTSVFAPWLAINAFDRLGYRAVVHGPRLDWHGRRRSPLGKQRQDERRGRAHVENVGDGVVLQGRRSRVHRGIGLHRLDRAAPAHPGHRLRPVADQRPVTGCS